MTVSYRQITPEVATSIRLVMADVDGTLTPGRDAISPVVFKAIQQLKAQYISVGLVSGRTLPELESMATELGISGPIIAENGGVAKLKPNGNLIDLGYSRQPALKALEKLRTLFPNSIQEREDNRDRLVDVVFWSHDIEKKELMQHLADLQLLDSGYILHLMQNGISKGRTLIRLLGEIGDKSLSPPEIMVFGDSTTDISLFELFPQSVLIVNPGLPMEQREMLRKTAKYESELPFGEGFAEVSFHILNVRAGQT